MRKLVWFTIGFGIACGIAGYFDKIPIGIVAIVALLIGIGMTVLMKKWKPLRIGVAILLGIAVGAGWFCGYNYLYLRSAKIMDGRTIAVTAEVTGYSYSTNYGGAVEAQVRRAGRNYDVLLYLNEPQHLIPGDVIEGSFRFRYTAAGEDLTYHRGDGVFILGYQDSDILAEKTDEIPMKHFPTMLRRRLSVTIDRCFPSDTAFFAKALLLGDRTDVDYESNTAFKVSGISHIIAVSGLHISILFSLVVLLCGRRRLLTTLIGVPVLLLFAAVVGFTPSVTRACIMQILMLLALLFNREYDPPTALSFAALVMLVFNPMVITSASFQMSVGCMAGIFLFSKRITDWINGFSFWREWKGKKLRVRFRNWISTGVGITVSAMFFTTPLVAYYFGTVSLIGILTNFLTLWVISAIFYGILAVCMLYSIWAKAAIVVAWCVSWLIRYVLMIAKTLSSFPLAAETLLSQGISCLDGVIVTHYDRDHAGGVGYLLSRIPADTVFLPDSPDEDGLLDTILPYCQGDEVYVKEDMLLRWDDTAVTVFAPILSTSDNERGLCVLFHNENCDILISGDLSRLGEKLLVKEKDIPELTVLVAGHHGSKNSTCEALLEATTPEYAFISVGKDNYYGHPHADVIKRLEEAGCIIYRTDQNGTIIFRR